MIIDTHSHFGKDYYCGDINIDNYIDCCKKMGVTTGFLMPSPWPMYEKDGKEIVSLIWEHQNFTQRSYYKVKNGNRIKITENPYLDVNYAYYNLLKEKTQMDLRFVPLLHGVLDTGSYLEKILNEMQPPAIKIHNFASGFSIDNINMELIDVIKQKNIPLIIHTSVYNYDYGYGASTSFFRNECHPYKWAKFLIDNNLRGVLNHGACLNQDAIELVNKCDNLMIGTGPDLDISRDYFKVDLDKEKYFKSGYLNLLMKMVLPSKLLFDVDFNWNLDFNKIDTSQISRFNLMWSSSDLDKILCENALNFFDLSNERVITMARRKK